MATNYVIGPTLRDLTKLGASGDEFILATAFYSRRPLEYLTLDVKSLLILCRLNLQDNSEWEKGYIDPLALHAFAVRHQTQGVAVNIYYSPRAHAKAYIGTSASLVGSANLTLRAFSGNAHELLMRLTGRDHTCARRAAKKYRQSLRPLEIDVLAQYIERHSPQTASSFEDTLASAIDGKERRQFGSYDNFLAWLSKQPGDAAATIFGRAHGDGNLSGHIRRNFYGLRQYLIAFPEEIDRLGTRNPELYTLHSDKDAGRRLAQFVRQHAVDEEDFSLSTWKTYLPKKYGGRQTSGGATVGNVNRMLPLIATYLTRWM